MHRLWRHQSRKNVHWISYFYAGQSILYVIVWSARITLVYDTAKETLYYLKKTIYNFVKDGFVISKI